MDQCMFMDYWTVLGHTVYLGMHNPYRNMQQCRRDEGTEFIEQQVIQRVHLYCRTCLIYFLSIHHDMGEMSVWPE